jgi:multidrug/hemolysin transport system ATP-binding protein
MENAIVVVNLRKSYGPVEAVKDISFYVEKGKFYAFLGPNGAGKSTTIDILSTALQPDSGTVVIDGHTIGRYDKKIRSSIGVVFQDNLLDSLLSVKENLDDPRKFLRYKRNQVENRRCRCREGDGSDRFS